MKLSKIINSLFTNMVTKWIIIPCILLLLWLSLSLVYSSYKSFTVLQYGKNQDENNDFFGKVLLKGRKLSGQFEANEKNLGIIAVKFGRVPNIEFDNEDTIIFRIKEKGEAKWFYENSYRAGLAKPYQYLTFGFMPIKNSKGRIYIFEVVSLSGNSNNALEAASTNPVYLSKYKFSRNDVFRSIQSFSKFMMNKLSTFYTDSDVLASSSIFLLPFIFYCIWIIVVPDKIFLPRLKWKTSKIFTRKALKVSNKVKQRLFTSLVLILIFYYLFFFEQAIVGFTIGLLGGWIVAIYINKFKSKTTFILAFIFISLSIIFIYFNWLVFVDKISTFAYFFIAIGFVQSVKEKN